jgi:rhodanese-related sulfurtransferase
MLVAIIVIGGTLPLGLYWLFVARVPSLAAGQAKELLSKPGSPAALLDVRPRQEYADSHLEGAGSWPLEDIMALRPGAELPEPYRGKTLLLICNAGLSSALAARKLREISDADVFSVSGGMQAWVADARRPCLAAFCRVRTASAGTTGLPFRRSSWLRQFVAVVTAFAVKPFYMLLALVLVGVLWRSRSSDLVALRWGLTFFFLGELVCLVNFLLFRDQSRLLEYLHSFGMVLTFGFNTYAVFEALDLRLVRYSDPDDRCAALGLCRSCIKYADVPCGLRRVFYVLIPAHIALAFIPFLARPQPVSYNTEIFGAFYNYAHFVSYQLYELRYLPLAAMALMTASLLALVLKKTDPVRLSKVLFACGMGALGFSLLRLFTFAPYRNDLVWFIFWEEATELMFVVGVGILLWIFRRGLFGAARPA